MLRLKAKELTDDPSFKASRGWYEKWKTTPLGQHANENNSGPAIARRPRRECCAVSPLRHCTNFIKVTNQYSEVIFVVFYYFCFIANLTTSRGVKLFSNCIFLKSKTLGYKPNPVLREKSPKILGRKLKKSLGL